MSSYMNELAENKLIILYILNYMDFPISNSQLTQIVLENNLINYFSLQQYIGELAEGGLTVSIQEDKRKPISITDKGKSALEFFKNRITQTKKDIIDDYITNNLSIIKKDVEVMSEFDFSNDKGLIVSMTLKNKDSLLMNLKIPVSTTAKANELSAKWKENYCEYYEKIMDMLKD